MILIIRLDLTPIWATFVIAFIEVLLSMVINTHPRLNTTNPYVTKDSFQWEMTFNIWPLDSAMRRCPP